jgi:hypothetical protein
MIRHDDDGSWDPLEYFNIKLKLSRLIEAAFDKLGCKIKRGKIRFSD